MTANEIGRRIDALGLWDAVYPYHWAVKPSGTVLPYFFAAIKGDRPEVKARLLLLEGWQTFHDFVRTAADHNFGWYSTPIEFAHFELVVLANGSNALFRHDPGYLPVEPDSRGRALCERMLWEVFGVMMRIETEKALPLKYAGEKALFARVENRSGEWSDQPLSIPDPRPHVEHISFAKADLKKAKDIPFAHGESIEIDCEKIVWDCLSVKPESGLRGLWESMPKRVLSHIISRGRVPGEVKVVSGRVFRLLRPLCMEIPFKLSLHDRLPRLEALFAASRN